MPDEHDAPAPVDLDNIDRSRLVVRQLTPTESERLMGFPEDWTAVEVNGAVMKDKDRYKCIGKGRQRLDALTVENFTQSTLQILPQLTWIFQADTDAKISGLALTALAELTVDRHGHDQASRSAP